MIAGPLIFCMPTSIQIRKLTLLGYKQAISMFKLII